MVEVEKVREKEVERKEVVKVSKKKEKEKERREKLSEAIIQIDHVNQHEAVYNLVLDASITTWQTVKKQLNSALKMAAEVDEDIKNYLEKRSQLQKKLFIARFNGQKKKAGQLKEQLQKLEDEFKKRFPSFIRDLQNINSKISILKSEKRKIIKKYINDNEITEYVQQLDNEINAILKQK